MHSTGQTMSLGLTIWATQDSRNSRTSDPHTAGQHNPEKQPWSRGYIGPDHSKFGQCAPDVRAQSQMRCPFWYTGLNLFKKGILRLWIYITEIRIMSDPIVSGRGTPPRSIVVWYKSRIPYHEPLVCQSYGATKSWGLTMAIHRMHHLQLSWKDWLPRHYDRDLKTPNSLYRWASNVTSINLRSTIPLIKPDCVFLYAESLLCPSTTRRPKYTFRWDSSSDSW